MKELFPYQKEGSAFLRGQVHALLGDEPGLGKTVQAIHAFHTLGLKTALVICPASVRLNWLREIAAMLGSTKGWDVISYNGASTRDVVSALRPEYDAVILDEGHFLKSIDSRRTLAVLGRSGLARRGTRIWVLTGTPVLNRPRELYPILKTLCPSFADIPYNTFAQRYCGAFFDGRGWNTRGASHLDELRARIGGFMLRRFKADVLEQLPDRLITFAPLQVQPEDLALLQLEESLISNRESFVSSVAEDFSAMGDISRLLRVTGLSKVRATTEYIRDLLATVDKVVVFAKHREVITRLHDNLNTFGFNPVVYHGGMSDKAKDAAVQAFKTPACAVFIGQIQAAGTGINGLQEVCDQVVFAELTWVPGETGQAIDRLHRLGQKSQCVTAHILHVSGTLESAILAVQERKTGVITKIVGGA